MDIFFRRHEEYERKYNCSFYSIDTVPIEQRQHKAYGIFLMSLCVVFELLYIPCVFAMLQKKLRRRFCYRMMTLMGIYDMLLFPTTAFLPGFASYHGYEYCSFPNFYYIVGMILCALWMGYAVATTILAFNRCLQFSSYSWIFEGRWRERFWLMCPVAFTFYMWYFGDRTVTYSVIYGCLFYNVHAGYFPDPQNEYPSNTHLIVNFVFSFLVPGVYAFYFKQIYLLAKLRTEGVTKSEYSLFFQLAGVNITIATAAFFTAALQFIPMPAYLLVYSHLSWVFVAGVPPLVYLIFNKSIQNELIKNCCGRRVNPTTTSASQASQTRNIGQRNGSQHNNVPRSAQENDSHASDDDSKF